MLGTHNPSTGHCWEITGIALLLLHISSNTRCPQNCGQTVPPLPWEQPNGHCQPRA